MTDKNKKLTKEEKIQKAVNLLKEVVSLELSDEDLKDVVGGCDCKQHEVERKQYEARRKHDERTILMLQNYDG